MFWVTFVLESKLGKRGLQRDYKPQTSFPTPWIMTLDTQRLYGRFGKLSETVQRRHRDTPKRTRGVSARSCSPTSLFPRAQQMTCSTTHRNGRAGLLLYAINQFLMKKQQAIKKPSKTTRASPLDFPRPPTTFHFLYPRRGDKITNRCLTVGRRNKKGVRDI